MVLHEEVSIHVEADFGRQFHKGERISELREMLATMNVLTCTSAEEVSVHDDGPIFFLRAVCRMNYIDVGCLEPLFANTPTRRHFGAGEHACLKAV